MSQLNVSDEEWLHGDCTPKGRPDKRTTVFDDALAEAVIGRGFNHNVRGSSTTVKAVEVGHVKDEFDKRYIYLGDDPAKASNARRMAFERALEAARKRGRIGTEASGKLQLVWSST